MAMKTIRLHQTLEQDGELNVHGLPYLKGQSVELIIRPQESKGMRVADLLKSDIVGMWTDRTDIEDSVAFARRLREQVSHRSL
jgi:hypothetical protein